MHAKGEHGDFVLCPVCGARCKMITAGHYRKHGFSSATDFKEAHGLAYLSAPSKRANHSRKMIARNPMAGASHGEAALEKMRKNRSGKGLGKCGMYERTAPVRSKIARGVVQAMKEGRGPRGEWFFSEKAAGFVWTRSSWERRVLRVLDLHPCVEEVEVEPFAIPYDLDGRTRLYLPDLLLHLEGKIRELWEVKPSEMMEGFSESARKNRAKRRALDEYVRRHGMNGRWVTLEQIEGMEAQVGLRSWTGPGRPWVDRDNPDARPVLGIHYGERR